MRTRISPNRRPLLSAITSALFVVVLLATWGQQPAPNHPTTEPVRGIVLNGEGNAVSGAVVHLSGKRGFLAQTLTSPAGVFVFTGVNSGTYTLTAEKSGLHSQSLSLNLPAGNHEALRLTIQNSPPSGDLSAMQYSDAPAFTVAGVTDWTAIGGHGSDANLRTSETLARDTLALEPPGATSGHPSQVDRRKEAQLRAALAASPGTFDASHRLGEYYLHAGRYGEALPLLESAWHIDPANRENTYDLAQACRGMGDLQQARAHISALLAHGANSEWYHLAADIEEQSGDPLLAVRDYQQALALEPDEENYFALGSELLLHRAIWQAQETFRKGAVAWPKSLRLQTGLGASLFAAALYDEAALHLCAASDLDPTAAEPYLFMGKIETAAPKPLPCIEQKLARFVAQQPDNSTANYLYAAVLLKSQEHTPDPRTMERAESLLRKAVASDGKNADAWFELGNIAASRRADAAAIQDYRNAIDANPQLAAAHYRLAVAYERNGDSVKAKQEFLLHDRIAQSQQEATNQERKKIQQFIFSQPAPSAPPSRP